MIFDCYYSACRMYCWWIRSLSFSCPLFALCIFLHLAQIIPLTKFKVLKQIFDFDINCLSLFMNLHLETWELILIFWVKIKHLLFFLFFFVLWKYRTFELSTLSFLILTISFKYLSEITKFLILLISIFWCWSFLKLQTYS